MRTWTDTDAAWQRRGSGGDAGSEGLPIPDARIEVTTQGRAPTSVTSLTGVGGSGAGWGIRPSVSVALVSCWIAYLLALLNIAVQVAR